MTVGFVVAIVLGDLIVEIIKHIIFYPWSLHSEKSYTSNNETLAVMVSGGSGSLFLPFWPSATFVRGSSSLWFFYKSLGYKRLHVLRMQHYMFLPHLNLSITVGFIEFREHISTIVEPINFFHPLDV